MLREDCVHVWLLALDCLQRAAARAVVRIQRRFQQFREQLARGSQSVRRLAVAIVPGLAKHELAAVGRVAKIEVVCDSVPSVGDSFLDRPPCRPCIHAAYNDVETAQVSDLTAPVAKNQVIDLGSLAADAQGQPLPPPEERGFFGRMLEKVGL